MDSVLQGIAGVTCYIDDILVSSTDEESHLRALEEVLSHLEKHGFKLKLEKCEFLLKNIEYLGHIVSKDGIQPVPTKVEAIVNAPTPTNVQQLRSFLGLTNYYGKFIQKLPSYTLYTIYFKLLRHGNGHQSVQKLSKQQKTKLFQLAFLHTMTLPYQLL